MNTIELVLQDPASPFGSVNVLIDGVNLIDLARAAEAAPAAAQGVPHEAGQYLGLWAAHWRDLPRETDEEEDGRVSVLCCVCSMVQCSSLRVRITVTESTIIWDDFQQSFNTHWSYDSMGPYVFDRDAYEQQVASVTALFHGAGEGNCDDATALD